jgi:hypothetical protein
VIDLDTAFGEEFFHVTEERSNRRYHRTARVMTSGGTGTRRRLTSGPGKGKRPAQRWPASHELHEGSIEVDRAMGGRALGGVDPPPNDPSRSDRQMKHPADRQIAPFEDLVTGPT